MDATALKLRANASNFASAREAFLEARFRKTFEAAAIGIGICDLEGRIVGGNSPLARSLGYERSELAGIDLWKLASGESRRPESRLNETADAESLCAREMDELM